MKPRQDMQQSLRGDNGDAFKLSENSSVGNDLYSQWVKNKQANSKPGYNGLIPVCAINSLEWEAAELVHGIATLTLHIRDGKLKRFVTSRERSFIPEEAINEYPY